MKDFKGDRDLKEALDFHNCPSIQSDMGPWYDAGDGPNAKFMGRSYFFKMPERSNGIGQTDNRQHRIDQMMVTKKYMVGMQMHKVPVIRFPYATRRVVGRVKPGEVERKARKTGARKQTRSDVVALCKYMLYKNGKFMPGKMV